MPNWFIDRLLVVEILFGFVVGGDHVPGKTVPLKVFCSGEALGEETEQVDQGAGEGKERVVWQSAVGHVVG